MAVLPSASSPAPRKGTGFTNLQRYLSANQGNQLGSSVAGGISSTAQGVQSGLQTASNQFAQQAGANDLASAQNRQFREDVLNRLSGNQPSVSDNETSQFAKFRAGQYSGPTRLEGADKLSNQAREAEGLGRATSSEEGRTGLLQRFVGGPQYSQGQKKFDVLLLGQAPDLSSARQKTAGLATAVGRENQRAQATAQQKGAEAAKFGQETTQMLGQEKQEVQDPLAGRIEGITAQQEALRQRLASGQLTAEDYNLLGMGKGLPTFGLSLTDPRWYTAPTAPTESQVMTPQEKLRIQALAKLSGQPEATFYEGFDPNASYEATSPVAKNKFQEGIAGESGRFSQILMNEPIQSPYGGTVADAFKGMQDKLEAIQRSTTEGRVRLMPAEAQRQTDQVMSDYNQLVQKVGQKWTNSMRPLGGSFPADMTPGGPSFIPTITPPRY